MTSPFTCPRTEKKGMPTHRVTSPVTIFFFPMLILASCYIVPAHLYLNSFMVFWSSKVDGDAVSIQICCFCQFWPYFITRIYRDKQLSNRRLDGKTQGCGLRTSFICSLALDKSFKAEVSIFCNTIALTTSSAEIPLAKIPRKHSQHSSTQSSFISEFQLGMETLRTRYSIFSQPHDKRQNLNISIFFSEVRALKI